MPLVEPVFEILKYADLSSRFEVQVGELYFTDFDERDINRFLVLHDTSNLLAVASMYFLDTNEYLSTLEVLSDKQGQGLSHLLLRNVFAESSHRTGRLLLSGYTEMGLARLSRHIQRLQIDFPHIQVSHAHFC